MKIKFRGIRTDGKGFAFGDLIHGVGAKAGKMFILPITSKIPHDCDVLDGYSVKPKTVGQFTGLTDKNGKEIFEGDILKVDDAIMHVIWIQKFASFGLDKVGWAFIQNFGEAVDPENVEVIGNIHETKPEL